MNDGDWRKATFFCFRATHQHKRRATIGYRTGIGRGNGPVLGKRRAKFRNLVEICLQRLLVALDDRIALATLDRHWRHFAIK